MSLPKELLDQGRSWRDRTDHDGSFDDVAEHLRRGRTLQQRSRRVLDRPVAFRED